MKIGSFKYDALFQDHQKTEVAVAVQTQAPQGKGETSQFVLMSANLFRSSQGGLGVVDSTKGTDCPFYMMDVDDQTSVCEENCNTYQGCDRDRCCDPVYDE